MRLYTGTGDEGDTGLHDGSRAPKDAERIEAYGTVDELNATLGLVLAGGASGALAKRLRTIQEELFIVGSDLATPAGTSRRKRIPTVSREASTRLEQWIDEATAIVKPLRQFVLPGGCELAARLHLARTVCRRAERRIVRLSHTEPVGREIIVYVNRLGDLLFAWARQANSEARVADVEWTPPAPDVASRES